MKLKALFTFCCAFGTVCGGARAAEFAATPAATVEIPDSTGKFDFLRIDGRRQRLLAAHENDGTADYIDLKTQSVIKRLKIGGAVDHAVDADSTFYYVSVQEDKRVAVIDAESLKEVKSIKVGGPTDAMIFEPKNHLIYVTHDEGADLWVIDPVSAKVVATITIPGVPEYMVYDASADKIYLNIKDKNVVAVIDPAAKKVVGTWATAPAVQPHGLALDESKHVVYVAGGNATMVAIDTRSGSVVDRIAIADKVDQIAFDSAGKIIYAAGPNVMSATSTAHEKFAALGDIATAPTARNVAVDPATRMIWTTYTDGKVSYAKAWNPPAQ